MKSFYVLTAALLIASTSQAKVICTINAENKTEQMTFDQELFSGKVHDSVPRYFSLSADSTAAKEIFLDADHFAESVKMTTEKKVVAFFYAGDEVSIAYGELKPTRFEIESLSGGPLNEVSSAVILDMPAQKVGFICSVQN